MVAVRNKQDKMKLMLSVVLMLGAFGPQALAQSQTDASSVTVSVKKTSDRGHVVSGEFLICVSSQTAWDVLTDYNGMVSFVSSVKSSEKISIENGEWRVQQTMTGHAGLFHKRVRLLLKVSEFPLSRITFEDTLHHSFQSYSGSWAITDQGHDLTISYQLSATPNFFSPNFIAMGAFRNNVKNLLEQVRDEMKRRGQCQRQPDALGH